MNFHECVMTMVQRPGYLGVLPPNRVLTINQAGYIMNAASGRRGDYVRLRTADVLAVTWECWTPEQLQALAQQQPQG